MTKEILRANQNFINTENQAQEPILNFFDSTLPEKPYCTDTLGALFIRVKNQAIKRRYLQHNSPFDLHWFVFDVDRPTAHFDWYDRSAPAPNFSVMNSENGHAHLFYGLEIPVVKCTENPKVHFKPMRYAASIEVALSQKLEADPGYAGLISKNPLHKFWDVKIWEKIPYDLNWIADYLDLEPYEDHRKHLPPIGLGRNCTIFDVTRHWAYRQIRKPGAFLSKDFFIYEVTAYAAERNTLFPAPLHWAEIKAIGKSIGKWTWAHMSPQGFRDWGERRRVKSVAVRKKKSVDRTYEIQKWVEAFPGIKNNVLAEIFDVNIRTVERAKKLMKE